MTSTKNTRHHVRLLLLFNIHLSTFVCNCDSYTPMNSVFIEPNTEMNSTAFSLPLLLLLPLLFFREFYVFNITPLCRVWSDDTRLFKRRGGGSSTCSSIHGYTENMNWHCHAQNTACDRVARKGNRRWLSKPKLWRQCSLMLSLV